jgi:hypothetical protein
MRRYAVLSGLAGLVLGSIVELCHPCASPASTILVTPGPASIQAAMTAAAPGDSLLLAPGHYLLNNPVGVTKNVTILSQSGPDDTIVDLQYNFGSVFYVFPMQAGPTIQGLTIKRGLAAGTGAGAGVYAYKASPTIVNNLFYGNLAGNIEGEGGLGAAIAIVLGNPVIQHNSLVGNESGGGALFLSQCGGTVDHNVIAYNSDGHIGSADGFGLSCSNATTQIHDNIFWANLPSQIDPLCVIALPANGNITLNPQFCSPAAGPDALNADWHIQLDSPIAPGYQYAGWGAQVGTCQSTPANRTSWGRVKGIYR